MYNETEGLVNIAVRLPRERVIVKTIKLLIIGMMFCIWQQANANDLYKCPISIKGETPVYCVSILQLLSSPGDFHKKLVRVTGFLNLEFEGNALYLHKVDYDQMILVNSIWIDRAGIKQPSFNKEYALVEGTYLAGKRGHFGMFSGALTEITRIQKNLSRAEIESKQSVK